jgi:hypothetical protein
MVIANRNLFFKKKSGPEKGRFVKCEKEEIT